MIKSYHNNSQIEQIHKKLVEYLNCKNTLPKNASIRKLSANERANGQNSGFVGEIEFTKILPNNNRQRRVVTAYNDGSIGIATSVTSPSGELLKTYYGIRDRSWKTFQPDTGNIINANSGTLEYDSGLSMNVLSKAISKIYK